MSLGNIFRAFQPKDKVFFVLFESVANKLVEMSKDFHEGISDFDANDEKLLLKMENYEHEMDNLAHEIFVQLGKNFITPFDRDDITYLASGLDDIADYIYASARYIILYKTPEKKVYAEFTLLIKNACLEIQNAILNLKDFKNKKAVMESVVKINSIENIADDILGEAMTKLFKSNDAIKIMKVKTVLEYLEGVTDKAEDVANTLESIVIKYA